MGFPLQLARWMIAIGASATLAVLLFSTPLRAAEQVPQTAVELKLSFAPIVKKASPAVVNVYVRQRVKTFVSPFEDPLFKQFFGDQQGQPRERVANSLGSGVIVSKDGLVVTNNHVVKGSGGNAAAIKIALTDKREFDAELILADERSDLALLKIKADGKDFPFLEFDDSDAIEVGDLVLAIGNPFGVGQTVTSGIISALARTAVNASDQQYFIQTDAAINPGNSGGGLVDMQGRLVGINTAIFSRSGGSLGIGFAIPSNLVKSFMAQAAAGREIIRPWFGAKLVPVTREVASGLGLDRVTGALISEVYAGGPAEAAGLKRGDVVVAVDTHEIDDPRALTYRLATRGIGETAKVKYLRSGATAEAELALKPAPGLDPSAVRDLTGPHPFDGARVAELAPGTATEIGLEDLVGVIILAVQPGSIAQGLGLRPSDLIIKVNRQKVLRLETLETAISKEQRLWNFEIQRSGRILRFSVPG